VAINCKGRVFAKSLFVMQTLDPAVRLIAWQPVLLFELRAIAVCDYSANTELDPVRVFFWLFFRGHSRGLAIARFTGANRSGSKRPHADQHEESARRIHNIDISI
jgi:hypothetical protein